ncbi:hypothetical protein ABNF65_07980 [Paenibacillus larvae]
MQNIVNSIESVVEGLPEKKKELIKLRYWARPQTLTWEGVAQRIERDRTTAIRWRNEIIGEIANRIGWR